MRCALLRLRRLSRRAAGVRFWGGGGRPADGQPAHRPPEPPRCRPRPWFLSPPLLRAGKYSAILSVLGLVPATLLPEFDFFPEFFQKYPQKASNCEWMEELARVWEAQGWR